VHVIVNNHTVSPNRLRRGQALGKGSTDGKKPASESAVAFLSSCFYAHVLFRHPVEAAGKIQYKKKIILR